MKIYTIIGGVNGVGKSSLTGVLKSRMTDLGVIVDVDKMTAQAGGSALQGGKRAVRLIEDCIAKHVSFTQETTLSGHRIRQTARRVRDAGYSVRMFYVGLDTAGESLRRIANRVSKGGHDVPSADVERRFLHRWEAVADILPYCDEAEFYDNDNGFARVASYRNGELVLEGDYRPRWIVQLAAALKSDADTPCAGGQTVV